jgi:hypothetical protein
MVYNLSKISGTIVKFGGSAHQSQPIDVLIPKPSYYNLSRQGQSINLIDKNHVWKAINDAKLKISSRNAESNTTLNIVVKTNSTVKLYNRAILQTQIDNLPEERPPLLSLSYASKSLKGSAIFYFEIKNSVDSTKSGNNVLWASRLDNTHGLYVTREFILPSDIIKKRLEFILYVITDNKGQHILTVKNAIIN